MLTWFLCGFICRFLSLQSGVLSERTKRKTGVAAAAAAAAAAGAREKETTAARGVRGRRIGLLPFPPFNSKNHLSHDSRGRRGRGSNRHGHGFDDGRCGLRPWRARAAGQRTERPFGCQRTAPFAAGGAQAGPNGTAFVYRQARSGRDWRGVGQSGGETSLSFERANVWPFRAEQPAPCTGQPVRPARIAAIRRRSCGFAFPGPWVRMGSGSALGLRWAALSKSIFGRLPGATNSCDGHRWGRAGGGGPVLELELGLELELDSSTAELERRGACLGPSVMFLARVWGRRGL
jgi:hypothetical protein